MCFEFAVLLAIIAIISFISKQAWAVKPTPEEMTVSKQWIAENLASEAPFPPFSFKYGGQPSVDLFNGWQINCTRKKLDENRSEHALEFTDPGTGLEVRSEATFYSDFSAMEWVLYLKNTGTSDTPILENILPLDVRMLASNGNPVLHYSKGALCCLDDFAPVEEILGPEAQVHLQPGGGRSSSEILPFFNLDFGQGGVVLGIGWTGEWAATFSRQAENYLP